MHFKTTKKCLFVVLRIRSTLTVSQLSAASCRLAQYVAAALAQYNTLGVGEHVRDLVAACTKYKQLNKYE